jgi:hypothetical protein
MHELKSVSITILRYELYVLRGKATRLSSIYEKLSASTKDLPLISLVLLMYIRRVHAM